MHASACFLWASSIILTAVSTLNGPRIVDLTHTAPPDLAQVTQFMVSNRTSFGKPQLDYLLEHEPRSIVLFRDTNTVLIPHRSFLDMLLAEVALYVQEGGTMAYEEVDVSESKPLPAASGLIPATPCLQQRGSQGLGLLSFGYSVAVEYAHFGDLGVGASVGTLNFTWAFGLTQRVKLAQTVSFLGQHTCDVQGSQTVRLFYSPGTVEVRPRTRQIRHALLSRVILEDDWRDGERVRFLTEAVPFYYCATDLKMDLRCEDNVNDYHESDDFWLRSEYQD